MGEVLIPDDWDGEDYCCYAVMWPNSRDWKAILNGLIDEAGTGFYYNEATGNVTEAALAIKRTWEYNFKNEEVIMSCNDTIAEALLAIAQSLASGSSGSSGCGCVPGATGGSAGTGMIDNPPSETVDTPEAHAGDPPSGYSDWEQFDSLKCDWANYIYNQIITDVATMALVGATGVTGLVAILVPLLTNPVGWSILLTLATTMIAAAAESAFYGWISTHLDTYKDDYICAMIGGTNVESSISGFNSRVDANISDDDNFNTLTGYWASSILKGLATVASFNRMYEKQSLTVPEAECDCGAGDYEMWIGTETSEHPANPIVAETVFVEGWGCTADARELAIIFHVPVTITEITGDTGLGCGSCAGALIYHYFANEDFTSTIHDGNGRPQDDIPVSGVRSMYVLYDCDGNTPELTITYTLD
jgi:hypothetical protein